MHFGLLHLISRTILNSICTIEKQIMEKRPGTIEATQRGIAGQKQIIAARQFGLAVLLLQRNSFSLTLHMQMAWIQPCGYGKVAHSIADNDKPFMVSLSWVLPQEKVMKCTISDWAQSHCFTCYSQSNTTVHLFWQESHRLVWQRTPERSWFLIWLLHLFFHELFFACKKN